MICQSTFWKLATYSDQQFYIRPDGASTLFLPICLISLSASFHVPSSSVSKEDFIGLSTTHLFTYDIFIQFVALVRRLTVTFLISLERKEIFKHSSEVLFLVWKKIHNSNKTLLNSVLSTNPQKHISSSLRVLQNRIQNKIQKAYN